MSLPWTCQGLTAVTETCPHRVVSLEPGSLIEKSLSILLCQPPTYPSIAATSAKLLASSSWIPTLRLRPAS